MFMFLLILTSDMAWLVAALSMVVIWVASVCKIFFGATFSSEAVILDDGK